LRILGTVAIPALFLLATGCQSSRDYIAESDRLFSAQKYADSALIYRKAIQKNPQSGEAYYKLGRAQRAIGNYAAAYESFIRAVTLNPQLDQAQIELGNLYLGEYSTGRAKNAQVRKKISAIADQHLAKNPQSFAGLRFRRYLALTERKPEEAISFFQKAHAVDPWTTRSGSGY